MADRKTATDYSVSHGLTMSAAHFPGKAPIDAYGDGGFRFAEMSHRGSIICLPSGIYGWNVGVPDDLVLKNFRKILQEAENIEILLIGSGENLCPLDPKLRAVYYARVLEIPTPRWTAYEAKRFGIEMPSPDVPMTTQERAYTSPIWYTP